MTPARRLPLNPDQTDYGGGFGGLDDLNTDTMAWLVNLIITGDTDSAGDFNADGKVDILDVVFLKKRLAGVI